MPPGLYVHAFGKVDFVKLFELLTRRDIPAMFLRLVLDLYTRQTLKTAWNGTTSLPSSVTNHYNDVIMATIASQITSLTIVYSTVYSDADQRKHQSSASLAFVWGIHRDRWIPAQRASYAENVSIWWRYHVVSGREEVYSCQICSMRILMNCCKDCKIMTLSAMSEQNSSGHLVTLMIWNYCLLLCGDCKKRLIYMINLPNNTQWNSVRRRLIVCVLEKMVNSFQAISILKEKS